MKARPNHPVSRMEAIAVLAIIAVILSSTGTIAAGEKTRASKRDRVSEGTRADGLVVNVDKGPIGDARITFLAYSGDNVNAVAALPRAYRLRFDLVDVETGRPVPDAAILYKDDETLWYGDGEGDYDTEANWHAFRIFENGRPIFNEATSSNMRLAHILVLATGYQPVRLKMDENLEPGKPLAKRVEMKPVAPVELTIATPAGKSAVGATFETISPAEFRESFRGKANAGMKRLLDIKQTSDDRGIVAMPYPAFGDWAVYRIVHPRGYADFEVRDLRATIDGDTTIRRRIELARYATIRGTYLPEVAENEFLEVYRLKPDRMSIDAPAVRVELDEDGRFELGPRLAGWHSFVHRVRYSDAEGRGYSWAAAVYGPFKLTNGQTVDLTLGDQGRPVIGRLVLPDGFDPRKQLFEISADSGGSPRRPHAPADIEDDRALAAWWDAYWKSDQGQRYRYCQRRWATTAARPDGTFRFPMLRPGKYTLRLAQQPPDTARLTLAKTEFEIPEPPSKQPLDLGDVALSADK